MVKMVFVLGTATLFLMAGTRQAIAQASQAAGDRLKEAESAQAKSWKQVDDINREADRTAGRLQQSRRNGEQAIHGPASVVTKKQVGVASPYRKVKPSKAITKKK